MPDPPRVSFVSTHPGLDNEQEGDIIDAMFEKKVDKDEMIIKEGDEGDNFYIIERESSWSSRETRRSSPTTTRAPLVSSR